jgi:hypothetical protein
MRRFGFRSEFTLQRVFRQRSEAGQTCILKVDH